MDHLSSCYFCGIALDEPLGEYRFSGPDGDGATVTLCPACHRKLETIFQQIDASGVSPVDTSTTGTGEAPPGNLPGGDAGGETAPESAEESEDSESVDETDLQEAMEPDVPEEFGSADGTQDGGDQEDEGGADDVSATEEGADDVNAADEDADDVSADDISALAGNVDVEPREDGQDESDDELRDAMQPSDFDSLAADVDEENESETDGDGVVGGESEEGVGDSETADEGEMVEETVTSEDDTGDDGVASGDDTGDDGAEDVDPDVQAADDVATGRRDLEEVTGDGETDDGPAPGDESVEADDIDDGDALKSAMEPDVPDEFAGNENDESTEGGGDDAVPSDEGVETGSAGTASAQTDQTASAQTDQTASAQTDETDSVRTESSAGSTETGDDGSDETPRTTVSALEYNKVMRLLQNREFPVEREEIVEVAASAYDLTEADCAEVIDLAVDRGLIDEADGKLVRPE